MLYLEESFALGDLEQKIIEAKKKEPKNFSDLKDGVAFVLFGDTDQVLYLKVTPTNFNPSNVINLDTGEWDICNDIFKVYELPPLTNLIIPDSYICTYDHNETLSYKYDLSKITVFVMVGSEQSHIVMNITDRISEGRYRDVIDTLQDKLQKDIKNASSIITIDHDVLEAPLHINRSSIAAIYIAPTVADNETWKNNLNYILKGGVPLFM